MDIEYTRRERRKIHRVTVYKKQARERKKERTFHKFLF
jgi:hypothetical protein